MSEASLYGPWWLALALLPLLYTMMALFKPRQKPKMDQIPTSELCIALANALPRCVFFHSQPEYSASLDSYWSKQNREITPLCVVKPHTDSDVSVIVRIIKKDYDRCISEKRNPTPFALRSGGHSTIPGASNAEGGIIIDLSLFNQVVLADDRKTVTIGCGARWGDVSRKLDDLDLAVAGGRNSDVGVGGLTLGGGYSYFSPQHGFVCDNVVEFHAILASGEAIVASVWQNTRLWRALRGGGNNFAIVTRFVMSTIPCSKVWSGFLYMWSWKAPQVIRTFYDFVGESSSDHHAAGPLLCISYVQKIGITLIATHLMYTKPELWPKCWQPFKSISRIWCSNKVRTLTSATDELDSISPAGFRQLHISTTVQNDLPTLEFAHTAFKNKITVLRKVKGMVWTIVIQPLHKATMDKGDNVLRLSNRKSNLVMILFTAVWEHQSDDCLVNSSGADAINNINNFAKERGSDDMFRYLNWSDVNDRPFRGYGEDNLKFLKDVSKMLDPDGLFQQGCIGGFKLKDDQE